MSYDIVTNYRDMFEARISAGAKEKLPTKVPGRLAAEIISSWSYDMEGHAKKCVERYCEHAWMTISRRIVYSLLTNCPLMSVFGSYGL